MNEYGVSDNVLISFLASDEDNYDPVEDGLVEPVYDEPNEYEWDSQYEGKDGLGLAPVSPRIHRH